MDAEQTTPPETAPALAELRAEDGAVFALAERNVIGRSDPARGEADVDLGGLPEGGFVSRKHAEIWLEDDKWLIKDLGSSNGTFLMHGEQETKVETDLELVDGQVVKFGSVMLTFSRTGVEPETLQADPPDQSDKSD